MTLIAPFVAAGAAAPMSSWPRAAGTWFPLQAKWIRQKLGLKEGEVPDEMKLLAADGAILGGADALIRLARSIWWAWPLFVLAQIPEARPILRAAYRAMAKNRHCLDGHCALPPENTGHHRHLTSSFYEIP